MNKYKIINVRSINKKFYSWNFHKLNILILIILLFLSNSDMFSREIKVAVFQYKPAIFVDSDGKVKGFYVDMLEHIAKNNNWTITFINASWSESLNRIKSGEIDILTSAAKSPQRLEFMDYCEIPVMNVWSILYVKDISNFGTIFDVATKTIGIVKNDIGGNNFKDMITKFEISCSYVEFNSYDEVFEAIKNSKIDAGISNNIFGLANEGKYKIQRSSIVFNPYEQYFCTSKGKNSDLLNAIDRYLKDSKSIPNSTYYTFINNWLYSENTKSGIPKWVVTSIIVIIVLLIFSFLIIAIFKVRVNIATNDLKEIQKKLEHEIQIREESDEILKTILESTSSYIGEDFFLHLIHNLYGTLKSKVVYISKFLDEATLETVVFLLDNKIVPNESYIIKGTPSEIVLKNGSCFFEENISKIFPDDKFLVSNRAESYIGYPIFNSIKEVIGIIGIIDDKKLFEPKLHLSLLEIFANRAGTELERIETEKSLKKSENILKNIFDANPDLLSIHDKNFNIIMSNWHQHEDVSLELRMKSPKCYEAYMNKSEPCEDCHVTRVFESKKPISLQDKKGKNGTMREINTYPIFDENGDVIWVAQNIRDISDRVKAKHDLELSEMKFRSYVDNSPDGIFIIDNFGNYIDVNNAATLQTGYSKVELIKMNVIDLAFENDKTYFQSNLESLLLYGHFQNELTLRRKDNSPIYTILDAVKLDNSRYLGYSKDISQMKKEEQEFKILMDKLEEANRLKSIILGNLGHELRTPLNGIIGFSNLLSRELTNEDELEMAQFIYSSADRLKNTLNSLLALTELESQYSNLSFQEYNLPELVGIYSNFISKSVKEKQLELKLNVIEPDAKIYADDYLINNILFNLVDNAVKFTDFGIITLEVKSEKLNSIDYGIFSVIDTGIGIHPGKINTIFEPFRQGSEGLNRTHEGIGIGLTITKKMVEMLNGLIEVKSVFNQGTTFTVKIPSRAIKNRLEDFQLMANQIKF